MIQFSNYNFSFKTFKPEKQNSFPIFSILNIFSNDMFIGNWEHLGNMLNAKSGHQLEVIEVVQTKVFTVEGWSVPIVQY